MLSKWRTDSKKMWASLGVGWACTTRNISNDSSISGHEQVVVRRNLSLEIVTLSEQQHREKQVHQIFHCMISMRAATDSATSLTNHCQGVCILIKEVVRVVQAIQGSFLTSISLVR